MYVYRLKTALPAIARTGDGRAAIVTLTRGTIVHRVALAPMLLQSGLVDVTVNGETFSAFAQDLESRAERIDMALAAAEA